VPVEATGDPGEERPHDEGDDLVAGGVEADRLRGDLVVVRRDEAAAVGRAHEADDREHGQRRERVHPEDRGVVRYAVEPQGAPERVHVLEDDPDDLAEAQRHEGKVVALQPEGRYADYQAGRRGAKSPEDQRAQEQEALLERGPARVAEEPRPQEERDRGGEVGPDRHEARVAERELARVAVHEVERDREDDVDPDPSDDVQVVGVDVVREVGDAEGHEDGCQEGDERLWHRRGLRPSRP